MRSLLALDGRIDGAERRRKVGIAILFARLLAALVDGVADEHGRILVHAAGDADFGQHLARRGVLELEPALDGLIELQGAQVKAKVAQVLRLGPSRVVKHLRERERETVSSDEEQ